MFRKIPSKVKDTSIFQELKKEFSPQVEAVDSKAKVLMDRHAKLIFCGMILLIVLSFILSFFILKPEEIAQIESFKKDLNAIPEGFGSEFLALQNLSARALEIADLEIEIERIISQESLSKEDSAYLEKAIEQLQYFNKLSKEDEH